MPAPSEPSILRTALSAVWRPGGLLYLALLLAGLAAGLWPEAVYPPRGAFRAAPLPALKTVGLAQVAFILLVYPLVIFSRWQGRRAGGRFWLAAACESAGFLLAAVPFYLAAAYLADATAPDAIRLGLYVAGLFPLAWSAGAFLAAGRARGAVIVALLVVAAGLPAAFYIALEFLPSGAAEAFWKLAPATFAWQMASARAGSWVPCPVLAWLTWPIVAAIGIVWMFLRRPRAALPADRAAR